MRLSQTARSRIGAILCKAGIRSTPSFYKAMDRALTAHQANASEWEKLSSRKENLQDARRALRDLRRHLKHTDFASSGLIAEITGGAEPIGATLERLDGALRLSSEFADQTPVRKQRLAADMALADVVYHAMLAHLLKDGVRGVKPTMTRGKPFERILTILLNELGQSRTGAHGLAQKKVAAYTKNRSSK